MDKNKKKKITNLLILNTTFIIWLIILLFVFIQQYDSLSKKITSANELYSSYNTLKKDWFNISDLSIVSNKYWASKDLKSMISDKAKINTIIHKTKPSENYSTWINNELWKEAQFNKEIQNNEKILWNILPFFYQYWDSYSNDSFNDSPLKIDYQITLDNFISFVENSILRKNNIISFSPIWIESITFDNWNAKTKTSSKASANSNLNTIWSFVLSLDFQAKNSNISKLIEYIQNSWKLDIQNWKLINKEKTNSTSDFSSLDNLLMTIDNITLAKSLLNQETDNKWVIKIRFYVRWIWFEQLNVTKTKAISKLSDLAKDYTLKSKLCDNWTNPICKSWLWSEAVATLRNLLKDINAVQLKVNTKTKSVSNINADINQELSDWLAIWSSIDSIEQAWQKSISYINSQQQWAK